MSLCFGARHIEATSAPHGRGIEHVLLISVDGLHQSDLTWYVQHHPGSELARLVSRGAEYSNAETPVPSDSDPGMTAQMIGGDPRATGVCYDDEYNHDLFPPGTTPCTSTPPGSPVIYDSPDDINANALDAGEGLANVPGSILQMTSDPQSLLEPSTFPVDPKTCKPIYPNQYLEVNTIFNVAHDAGLVTAWSDKHPIYSSFEWRRATDSRTSSTRRSTRMRSSPTEPRIRVASRGRVTTPRRCSTTPTRSQAVLNWIDGFNHQGTQQIGVPAARLRSSSPPSTASPRRIPIS